MFIENFEVINSRRELAYDQFRLFCHDPGQEGDTLGSVSPFVFNATRSLAARRASLARLAYRPDQKVVGTTLLVPQEICRAAGFVPFNWEMYASLIASHSGIIELTNKGSVTAPRCSFINALKGAYVDKILAPPDITLSSTAYCESISYMIEEISKDMNKTHFHIDIPGYLTPSTVNTLAMQIEEVYSDMCKLNNIESTEAESRLRQVMKHSVEARSIYLEIYELRKKYGPLNMGLEPLHWHFQFFPLWGDESATRVCRNLKQELEQAIEAGQFDRGLMADEGIPLAVFGLIPYGRTDLWKKIQDAGGYFVFEGVNYMGDVILPGVAEVETMPIKEIYENLAYNLLQTPIRGGNLQEKANRFMSSAKEMGAKGMIIFSHEHCQMLAPRLTLLEEEAVKNGMSVVSIGGDCILGMPKGPAGIRLGTFLSGLNEKIVLEPGIKLETSNNLAPSIVSGEGIPIRLGVDFGSGYSKYIVLDDSLNILQKGMFSSGIDYPSLLSEICSRLPGERDFRLAVSGVGGDHPRFKDLVHVQTTEIMALINSVRTLFASREKILVVDIGTQDVKVLKFESMTSNPWINTNKSCGAGTGLVLAQLLERWKQTWPEITFDKLDEMAMEAGRAEIINTTCGIFAVTNVVSALVQAEDDRRKEILKGVYQYIATQAIKLLPAADQKGGEVFLTGGIAGHKSLRNAFEQKGFKIIPVPDFMHPQFLVAFGTALSIN
jgi:activator of 2-hydroxyglutaryl-CoA dehydratase/benzoyl-CoA reductase/2-hydroxyglutaryl-CoA dehydratase subunit BcrC/BadD/HgdB